MPGLASTKVNPKLDRCDVLFSELLALRIRKKLVHDIASELFRIICKALIYRTFGTFPQTEYKAIIINCPLVFLTELFHKLSWKEWIIEYRVPL